jgi:hypothetical protein
MGVRVIGDYQRSVMYCSTTEWAFGPVFTDSDDGMHDADERIHSFLRYVKVDPRSLTDRALELAYSEWLAQERVQWATEKLALEEKENG